MKKIYFGLTILAAASLFSTVSNSSYQFAPQGCSAESPGEGSFLSFLDIGVWNTDTAKHWVICPITKNSQTSAVDVAVKLRNFGNTRTRTRCILTEVDMQDRDIFSAEYARSKWIPKKKAKTILFSVDMVRADSTLSVRCNLPPNTLLASISVDYF